MQQTLQENPFERTTEANRPLWRPCNEYLQDLMCVGPCIIVITENKNQLDVTYYFIVLLIGSTCFGDFYAHHQDLTTI